MEGNGTETKYMLNSAPLRSEPPIASERGNAVRQHDAAPMKWISGAAGFCEEVQMSK